MLRAWRWCAVALLTTSSAGAQVSVTPQRIPLDTVTCLELLSVPGERRDRLLIYLNGYFDGAQRATIWDERVAGERVERALATCKSRPETTVLRAFADAWSR